MKYACSGVILAGGQNSRFMGKNKAFIRIGGKSILDHIYSMLKSIFDEIILVSNDPTQFLDWDFEIVTDIFPIRSSLTGLHAGLFFATNPYAFFTACDTPFLKKELVKTIVDNIESSVDVLIPKTSKGIEPLCAVYSKRCTNHIKTQIVKKKLKIQRFFRHVRTKHLPEKKIRDIDPDLISFFNINSPDDLAEAEKIVQCV